MNIKQIEKILTKGGIEPNEAKIEAKMLVKHFLGEINEIHFVLNEEFDVNEAREDLLQAANLRAQKRIPIQHILGYAYFMGENFIVNKDVLIPRDETEILVREAVEIIKRKEGKGKREEDIETKCKNQTAKNDIKITQHTAHCSQSSHFSPLTSHLKILDIGTGSGCIACIIAKLTSAQVLGIDISSDALQVALENSSNLGLFNKAIFRKSDIFSSIRADEKFDIIISNPPYIPLEEKKNLQKEVQFEPDLALFAKDNEGIEFYEQIIEQAPDFLNPNGYLMFELGVGQSLSVKKLMEKCGFKDIEIKKDLAYIDRVIIGQKGK